ncbi:probable inactive receptor kinase At2g26730 [Coffea arabica]|uniref:Probable inactive receptor kinase At2g26730 n=1 Tax=Coffea arabica TaxID=13443 RepID=A0A6P6XJB7_COFAR|nr:probable inactive receptor kinase At2g26730 [Coffea arabica]
MLSRALNSKPRRSFHGVEKEDSCRSAASILSEYGGFMVGFMDDLPLISCGGSDHKGGWAESQHLTLRQVLRSSVAVVGESRLGFTEKVVLPDGRMCALKRFRKVSLRRGEFGRRIVRVGLASSMSDYLVPVTAYFYSKRIKFAVSDYYPMGSLADLLASAREQNQTALTWNQRLEIILSVARAVEFIHSRNSLQETKHLKLNVHGNVKASNVMINIDFTARLSDYGFIQLAERVEVGDAWQRKPQPNFEHGEVFCQESDVYNFGIIILDLLQGPNKDYTNDRDGGHVDFEFCVQGKERDQALQVLEIGLACTNKSTGARPTIQEIILCLGDEVFM